jgi:general secretion pathway protein H
MRPQRSSASWTQRRTRGFTLIELMVVVLIVGLLAAATVISISITGRDTELEKESERAFSLVKYAREKAELQTREFGLYCGEGKYEFLTYDARKGYWRSVEEDESLRLRELPDGLKLRLVVEGREVVLKGADSAKKTDEQLKKELKERVPHVIIYSNGDLTPFKLVMLREDPSRSVTIASTDDGTIKADDMVEGKT